MRTFYQNQACIYYSLKVNQKTWQIADHIAKDIHFHPFIFINVAATIFILYAYPNLLEISYAISCCLPTGKLTTMTQTKFNSKYFICLQLAYQFPSMSSRFSVMDWPSEQTAKMTIFEIHVKISQFINSLQKK